ncbi:MAG TPA: peroxiredoxin [Candidatus Cloacimonetes bacterium]|nr:peroxiredoxin [Candidatus Cloacimonadota bacterium]
MGKVAMTLNGSEAKNIYPAITIAVSALASGDEVLIFVLPSGLPVFVGDKIAELNKAVPELPDLEEMFESYQALGGRILVCELGFEVHGLKEEDLIEGCEVVGATTFVSEAQGAQLTLSF